MWASIETPESADLEKLLTEREYNTMLSSPWDYGAHGRRRHCILLHAASCLHTAPPIPTSLNTVGHKVTPAEAAKKTANRAIKKDGRKKSRKQDVQKLTNVHMMALVGIASV
jgi:hypothetical protein